MRKPLPLFALLFLLLHSCSHFDVVQYHPNPNDKQPLVTIERVLREQPLSWGNVPSRVFVRDDCIEMLISEERGFLMVNLSSSEVRKTIYYKHIGKTVLHKHRSGVWYVEIQDHLGQWIYSVNCYEESDARAFIDALYTMKLR